MANRSRRKCTACKGMGWYFFDTGNRESPRYEVQRCDVCERYDSDLAALEAVEQTCRSQATLRQLVERISRVRHASEPPAPDAPFEHTSEDTLVTLNQLIMDARVLLGTADRCDQCGKAVPYIIGCPDGTKVCPACFEAGQH